MKIAIIIDLMLKKTTLILSFFLLTLNCTVTERPKFLGLDNIKVNNLNIKSITLSTDALFINPNNVGGVLKTDHLKIYINDNEVATLVSKEFKVPSKKSFKIPLTVTIATDSIIDRKSIGGLLGSLVSKKLNVHYKGKINYKVLGYSSSYDIDKIQEIKIKR